MNVCETHLQGPIYAIIEGYKITEPSLHVTF
jgi:hypothetical protein